MSCNHDTKYGIMFAKNGCLACELEHVTMLAKQLYEALSVANHDCENLHHEKSQYHSSREICPVVDEIDQAMTDYQKWLHKK